MKLNEEQLRFFYNEVLGELGWCDEIEETEIDPLVYVFAEINKLRKEVNRLKGYSPFKPSGDEGLMVKINWQEVE